MDPTFSANEIFERCADLPERAGDVRLRPYEWHFLMALDGRKTAAEVAAEVRLDAARLPGVVQRLVELKLMEVPELTWKEFAARYPAVSAPALPPPPPPPPPPLAPTPAAPVAEAPKKVGNVPPAAVTFAITRAGAAGRSTAPAVPVTEEEVAPPVAAPVHAPAPAEAADEPTSPGPVAAAAEPALNLKQLIDYVTQHAGGGLRGKLAVYRLFLRVPNDQIRAAGIESLNFVDDRFEIHEPAMRSAILEAVHAVTGRPYPLSA